MDRCLASPLALLLCTLPLAAQDLPETWLVRAGDGRGGRSPLRVDAVEAVLVTGRWQPPRAGAGGWSEAKRDAQGSLAVPRGGWAFGVVASPEDGVRLLTARGAATAYVNGEPRAGDVYRYGWLALPVKLRRGANEILLESAGRGPIQARLLEVAKPVFLSADDATLPDLVLPASRPAMFPTWIEGRERHGREYGAVVVVNARDAWLTGHVLQVAAGGETILSPVPALPPFSVRKVAMHLPARLVADESHRCAIDVRLVAAGAPQAAPVDAARFTLAAKTWHDVHRRTFVSAVDGSVQYYALLPAKGAATSCCLTLHGAGVEATGQLAAYAAKPDVDLVAPTNRRPFGFDWEEWGRIDALEALSHYRELMAFWRPPGRANLTGHSMGGHGAWHLAVTHPDHFQAVAPSAGWVSFATYGGGAAPPAPGPIGEVLARAAALSDTLALATNLKGHRVYVLHGDADDNVRVDQARRMRDTLAAWHPDFHYHEQKGAGHWWDASPEPGASCVDWPPIFELFAKGPLPGAFALRAGPFGLGPGLWPWIDPFHATWPRDVDFTTVCPGVSATREWITIANQRRQLAPSRVQAHWDPDAKTVTATTDNVALLGIDLQELGCGPRGVVTIDGQRFDGLAPRPLWLERAGDVWRTSARDAKRKGPHRHGPFKAVFAQRFLLVAGTRGSAEENAWALAKARYDAETFYYRGNGSVDVVRDTDVDPARCARNVVLYGNARTNAAWPALLGQSPVQVEPGRVRIGERSIEGDDLACLFVRPRLDDARYLVGAVSGSGLVGMRLCDRMAYFTSGVHFPDLFVAEPSMLVGDDAGVLAAGFFGNDWGVEGGVR